MWYKNRLTNQNQLFVAVFYFFVMLLYIWSKGYVDIKFGYCKHVLYHYKMVYVFILLNDPFIFKDIVIHVI